MFRRSLIQLIGLPAPVNFGGSPAQPIAMSPREAAIEQLAVEVFSKGNKILKVVDDLGTLPEGLHSFPEVCFVGKPSCGKSSVIATLCHNIKMGRTGRGGGRTTKLEFFNVGDCMLLVDTPSYGSWERRTVALNALGVTLMRRYISLRKEGNLKHVYWLIESPQYEFKMKYQSHVNARSRQVARDVLRIEPRDEEMLDFLAHEKVPFTVLLSKADRLQDKPDRIRRAIDDVHEFIGTDDIPVMPISCRPRSPAECRNVHELMCDITDKCCGELKDNELTLKGLHSLSYLPPTAQSIIAVEANYPVGAHVMPISNSRSISETVKLHNEAKLGFVRVRQASKLFGTSFYEKALGYSNDELVAPSHDAGVATSRLSHNSLTSSSTNSSVTTGTLVESPINETSSLVASPTASNEVLLTTKQQHDKLQVQQQQLAAMSVADLLPKNRENATTISNVLGVALPVTMVGASVTRAAKAIDRSADAYAEMVEAQGYYGIVNSSEDFFITAAGTPSHQERTLSERKNGPRYASHREIAKQRMLDKYVKGVRKDRSIQLDAHGYMCPWLGSNSGGGPRVKGSSVVTNGGSGALVRGLKESGFGGHSLSRKTTKNTFRATKKTGFWAT